MTSTLEQVRRETGWRAVNLETAGQNDVGRTGKLDKIMRALTNAAFRLRHAKRSAHGPRQPRVGLHRLRPDLFVEPPQNDPVSAFSSPSFRVMAYSALWLTHSTSWVIF